MAEGDQVVLKGITVVLEIKETQSTHNCHLCFYGYDGCVCPSGCGDYGYYAIKEVRNE